MEDENPDMQVNVQVAHICDDVNLPSAGIEELVKEICGRFDFSNAMVSIAIADDEHITRLNEQFLKKNNTTDVLSFDLSDDHDKKEKCFEIVVNAQQALRHAENHKHSAQTELALYIAHGLLHQMGFDDHEPDQTEKMHKTEEQILQHLGYDFEYDFKEN